jgi:SAM-dependent methyltransferase
LTDYERLTQSMRWMWSLGDYRELAQRLEPCALELAQAVDLRDGMKVLDVAAGNGNFALAAARLGARVTACDLTPRMIELGRERAARECAAVEWIEANAETLPFDDGGFDLVASVFGAMFAARTDRVAAELCRVARPGGIVAMANYAPSGFLAEMGKVLESMRPPGEDVLPSPFLWGDDGEVRRRFDGLATSIETRRRTAAFEFASLEDGWAFWERTNPPQSAIRAMLPPDAYAAIAQRGEDLMASMNRSRTGGLLLEWDWLMVLAHRPAEGG